MSKIWVTIFGIIGVCFSSAGQNQPCSYNKDELSVTYLTLNQLLSSIDNEIIKGNAQSNICHSNGAMGRNKKAYFHVRFQMGVSALADAAVVQENTQMLEKAVKSIEYSFQKQKKEGDFIVEVPLELAQKGIPSENDLASGIAFFASSLGNALVVFKESSWFQTEITSKTKIEALTPNVQKMLVYLKSKHKNLLLMDAKAPNRLFYDALAFYSLGKYLNDIEAQNLAITFAQKAINTQHSDGFFTEGNGWDSSYQGVGLMVGFQLLSLLPKEHSFYPVLYQALACGTKWQSSRIKPSGEISEEGNARVYKGGELFLGEEKHISWISTMYAFLFYSSFSKNDTYKDLAYKVKRFYYH